MSFIAKNYYGKMARRFAPAGHFFGPDYDIDNHFAGDRGRRSVYN